MIWIPVWIPDETASREPPGSGRCSPSMFRFVQGSSVVPPNICWVPSRILQKFLGLLRRFRTSMHALAFCLVDRCTFWREGLLAQLFLCARLERTLKVWVLSLLYMCLRFVRDTSGLLPDDPLYPHRPVSPVLVLPCLTNTGIGAQYSDTYSVVLTPSFTIKTSKSDQISLKISSKWL